jgi:Domain of unknown function (DUF1707)
VATRADLRIGDSDREAGAASLREHYAQGRLSLTEFNQRLDAIFAATTQGQLEHVTRDLPHVRTPAVPLPVTTGTRGGANQRGGRRGSHDGSWQGRSQYSGSQYGGSQHGGSWDGHSRAGGPPHALQVVSGLVLVLAIFFLALSPHLLHFRFPLPGGFGVLVAGLLIVRSLVRRLFGRRGR